MAKPVIVVKGLVEAREKLKKAGTNGKKATKAGLIEAGLLLQGESQRPGRVPIDLRNLSASHFTVWDGGSNDKATFTGDDAGDMQSRHTAVVGQEQAEVNGRSESLPRVTVGASAAYALKQHEDCSLNHPNGGTCKWMLIAFVSNVDKMISLIEDDVERGVKDV